jgi:hypothetical protein
MDSEYSSWSFKITPDLPPPPTKLTHAGKTKEKFSENN